MGSGFVSQCIRRNNYVSLCTGVDSSKADAVGSLHQTARGAAVTAKVRFCELQEVKTIPKRTTTPKQNTYRLKL